MKRAQDVIWLAIAAHFVSTKTGSNIINRVDQMQLLEQLPKLKKPRQLNKLHARLPIQVQITPHAHLQQIKQQLPLPPQLPPLSRMELSLHPSDGIS
jgi:hypothetical protein